MNRKPYQSYCTTCFLIPVFVVGFVFFWQKTYAAFVPASEPVLSQSALNPKNVDDIDNLLANLGNKDMEKLLGRKLTFKEKAGLFMLHRQVGKKGQGNFWTPADRDDKCFTMYLKNGDVIEVKLIQISTTDIKYQRCNKPDDPEIIIAKADVFTIKDAKGEAIYSSKDESWKKGYGAADGETDKLALASGITGIAAVTLGLFIWPLGMAAALAAGVMGIVSLNRMKKSRSLRGQGWAITGIVAGGLWVLVGGLIIIALASW